MFRSLSIKKHENSLISENEFVSVIQAKLNVASMMENSKTIDDMIKSPKEWSSHLKLSGSKGSSIRKKVILIYIKI